MKSHFPKGRKADRGFRRRVQDYLVKDQRLVQVWTSVKWKFGQRSEEGSILFDIQTEATTDRVCRLIY